MSGLWGIGLDVGGTKIAGGLVDLATGQVVHRRQIPTGADRDGDVVLRDAVAVADDLGSDAASAGVAVHSVGIGVAELVDVQGAIRSAHVIDWPGQPVREAFAHIAPVMIESDVRAAALAEARFGAGRPFAIFVYVTVGTGISSCLVQGGVPFPGSRGNALVLASGPVTSVCDRCGTREDTVLEDVASGPALATRYARRHGRDVAHGWQVVQAAEAGEPDAVEVVGSAGEALGNAVGWLVNVLDPAAVVVGGGLGMAGGLYRERFVSSTRAHVWSPASRDLPILAAGLAADSGIIGAAVAAAEAVKGTKHVGDRG